MEAIPINSVSNSLETSLTDLLKEKDLTTDAHSCRVAEITAEWINHMKSRREWVDLEEQDLVLAARLHDIGKLGVRSQVLNKPGPLTSAEREHMNQHPQMGYALTQEKNIAPHLALAILHHHERWDGSGYPSGLKEDEIPFFAQVISIVDSYDAITSERPYRSSRSEQDAIHELEKNAGCQFSPLLVTRFVKFLNARNT